MNAGSGSDDAGLLVGLTPSSQQGAMVAAQPAAKRLCLRRADYASSQIFQPHAPCAIEKAGLKELWEVVRTGNPYTEFYSYLAHPESIRQGVAISQCAQTLKYAISHFRESRVQHILKESVYAKVKLVADGLYPHLETLDGGYNLKSKAVGFARLGRTITTKSEAQVEAACVVLHEWLTKPDDALRAYLTIMSGAGIVYAAQCEEKVLRAFVTCGGLSQAKLSAAAKLRLCTDEGAAMVVPSQDDRALTQD